MNHIAGIDLSLTSTGVAVAPADWDGDWGRVRTHCVSFKMRPSPSELERVGRLETISGNVARLCQVERAFDIWIESPAYAGGRQLHAQGELSGIVKHRLKQLGSSISIAQQSSVRKLLLGKVPRKSVDIKTAVRNTLIAAGAPRGLSWDEYDALAVLNWAMHETGGYCYAQVRDD